LYEETERAIDRKAQRRRFNVRNMEKKKSREELIDLYLLDKLLPQDRENFEEEMLRNDELCKEVEIMRRIITGFERKGETEAMDAMQNMPEAQIRSAIIEAENGHKRPVKKKWLYTATIGIAASIALLIYIGFQPKYSTEELYGHFYTLVEFEYIPSRGGEDLNEEEITFYTALSKAQTGKERDAIKELESIVSSVDSEFRDDALWNLALLYLKVGDRNKCSGILQSIIDDKNNPYANEANQLLDKLNTRRWF